MHNFYIYRVQFQLERKSDPCQAVLFTIHLIKLFLELYSFSETIHHSSNTYIKSIHYSAFNKHTICTSISIISKEFAENIIINNYNFLILFLCVSTPQLNYIHTTIICHEQMLLYIRKTCTKCSQQHVRPRIQ